jgi:hypothetical protein
MLTLLLSTGLALGQEICNNGIDDDLDGFVDCFDTECSGDPACQDFFVIPDPTCTALPTAIPEFKMKLAWKSAIRTARTSSLPSVGDIDGDGIPEVVVVNDDDRKVYVLDGRDGSVKKERSLGSYTTRDPVNGFIGLWHASPWADAVLADIDRDGKAEIFVPVSGTVGRGVIGLKHDLTNMWYLSGYPHVGSTRTVAGSGTVNAGDIGIADFDGDGLAEIYARDVLIDAHSGRWMNRSAYSITAGDTVNHIEYNLHWNGIAVDILPDAACANCQGLELIIGGKIYSVSINRSVSPATATLTLELSVPVRPVFMPSPWNQNRNGTSVADMNLDGYLDVVFAGTNHVGDSTRYYFWDVHNGVLHSYNDPTYNWSLGAGRPNIADVDGDGWPDATFVSGNYLYCIDHTWNLKWRMPIIETTSGNTGTTVYDFNGDGKYEVVYRDEQFLYIVDGVTGTPFKSVPCKSITWSEYPVVADVDGDGQTEICVTCMNDAYSDVEADPDEGEVRVFRADEENWVSARKVWNQHGYFNVNINDDLTIPRVQMAHHRVFSVGVCSPGEHRPLNTFLNQSPILTSDGCMSYAAPDLNFDGNIAVNAPQCPDRNFTVSFDVSNIGDKRMKARLPITFYSGNPLMAGATKLNTLYVDVDIPKGGILTLNNLLVKGTGSGFTLYISLNDDGSQAPPLTFPVSNILECNYDNNVGLADIEPLPLPLFAFKVDDNNKCVDSLANNGSATAYVFETRQLWFEDFEDIPVGATSDAGATSWTRTLVSTDTTSKAQVHQTGTNKEFRVTNSIGQAAWTSGIIDISAYDTARFTLRLRSESISPDVFENTDTLQVFYKINGGPEVLARRFIGSVGATTAGSGSDQVVFSKDSLLGNTLQIIVKFKNDGLTERYYLDNAEVSGRGTFTAGYMFNWHLGAPDGSPEANGYTYSAMAEGTYAVFAINNSTGCSSDTAQVVIDRTNDTPNINVVITNEQTNCKIPNGGLSATAEVYGGEPATNFTFEWYEGLDVFTSPLVAIGQTVSGLKATTYTVLVTEIASGCQAIKSATVPAMVNIPVVDPFVAENNTSCISTNGALGALVKGKGVLYFEDFEDLAVGATSDPGISGWVRTWETGILTNPLTHAEVVNLGGNNVFEVQYTLSATVNSGFAIMTTDTLDVTGKTNITLSFDVFSQNIGLGPCGLNDYFVRVYYITDVSGSWASIPVLSGPVGTLGQPHATVLCGTGPNWKTLTYTFPVDPSSTRMVLRFDIDAYANYGGNPADYKIDNVEVTGEGDFKDFYDFEWYAGNSVKPMADYTGYQIDSIPPGEYTVTATSKYSLCTSEPVTITLSDSLVYPVPAAAIAHYQSSCDPARPNGVLSANVAGDTTSYHFEWFRGANTLPANFLGTAVSMSGLEAGVYTLRATHKLTGCDSTVQVSMTDSLAVISATPNITNRTWCSPANGILDADGVGGQGPYTYLWYDGNQGAPDPFNPDYSTKVVPNLLSGDYTLLVRDHYDCISGPIHVAIADVSVLPVIGANLTDQTSCEPALPNGAISAHVGGSTAGFLFRIFTGANTNPANEIPGSPAATVGSLPAGIYTILATDSTTGCSSTLEVTVVENLTDPVVTATTLADQTICTTGAHNGQVGADVGGATAGYKFFWFTGNIAVPDTATANYTGSVWSGRTAGSFTVVARNNSTWCLSDPAVAVVADITVPPVITASATDNSSCDPATPNGQVTANVGGLTAPDYNFEWFIGQNTLPANSLGAGHAKNGLPASIYTVRAVNALTGCASTAEVTVTDNPIFPVAAAVTVQDQSNCSAGLINGEVSANVGGATAGYTFYWFDGNIGAPDTTAYDHKGTNYSGLTAGQYTVVAVSNALKCASAPAVATVGNAVVKPSISAAAVDNSSCDPANPNGQLSANVGGLVEPAFTFAWFRGQNTLPANNIGNSSSIAGFGADIYTVLVTEVATGCDTTAEVTIADSPVFPVAAAVTVQDQSNCSAGLINGEVSANVGGATAGYTFYWFDGNIGAPDTTAYDHKGISYSGLVAGQYTVVAVSNALKCASAPAVATVGNAVVKPSISAAAVDNSSCDPANPNGQLSANVGGLVEPAFTFAWFRGQNTMPANLIGNSSSIAGFGADIYTVLVTEVATGCDTTAEVTIADSPVFPVAAAVTVQDQSNCSAGLINGEVSANVGGATAGYTFYWFDGNIGAPDTTAYDHKGISYSGLVAGQYTVVAVSNALKCASAPAVATVGNAVVKPSISAAAVDNSSCDPANPNGQLSANVGGLVEPAFTFAWFRGQNTMPANLIGNSSSIAGFGADIYTVLVTEVATGCDTTAEVTIADSPVFPVAAAVTVQDQSNCSAGLINGEVSANVGGATAGYTFYWFDGNIGAPDTTAYDHKGISYAGLVAGQYTVVAVSNALKCASAPAVATVGNAVVKPSISAAAVDNSSCDPANPNGQLSANVGGLVEPAFTFAWFRGQNTLPANLIGNSSSIAGFGADIYTVLVTEVATGCDTTAEVTIADSPVFPVASAVTVQDQSNCSAGLINGEVSANVGGATAGYTFYWFDGNIGAPDTTAYDHKGISYSGLVAGQYTVVAVSNALKCASAPAVATVGNAVVKPSISAAAVDNSSCDPANPNGQLSANVGGLVEPAFTFAWFRGQNTMPANLIGNSSSIAGFGADIYTVLRHRSGHRMRYHRRSHHRRQPCIPRRFRRHRPGSVQLLGRSHQR